MHCSYVYIRTDKHPPLWTVGFYQGEKWVAESDHSTPEDAAERVRWLNGWPLEDSEPDLLTEPVGLALGPEGNPLVLCADGSVWTSGLEEEWRELLPIPGTERAHELDAGELEEFKQPGCDQLDLEEEIEQMRSAVDEDLKGVMDDLEAGYQGGEV